MGEGRGQVAEASFLRVIRGHGLTVACGRLQGKTLLSLPCEASSTTQFKASERHLIAGGKGISRQLSAVPAKRSDARVRR
jgi:hypothetical protein